MSIVKNGINVAIGQASRLLCNIGTLTDDMGTTDTADDVEVPIGGVPSITVSEDFPTAWEDGDQTRDRLHHDHHRGDQSARWA